MNYSFLASFGALAFLASCGNGDRMVEGFRANVYLIMSWSLNQAERFKDALLDAKEVIDNGLYVLEAAYANLFLLETEDGNAEDRQRTH